MNTVFDAELNPSNAQFKNYEYIDDLHLNKHDGNTEEFLDIMEKNNFKLGIPKRNEHAYYGLYIPKKDIDIATHV